MSDMLGSMYVRETLARQAASSGPEKALRSVYQDFTFLAGESDGCRVIAEVAVPGGETLQRPVGLAEFNRSFDPIGFTAKNALSSTGITTELPELNSVRLQGQKLIFRFGIHGVAE